MVPRVSCVSLLISLLQHKMNRSIPYAVRPDMGRFLATKTYSNLKIGVFHANERFLNFYSVGEFSSGKYIGYDLVCPDRR